MGRPRKHGPGGTAGPGSIKDPCVYTPPERRGATRRLSDESIDLAIRGLEAQVGLAVRHVERIAEAIRAESAQTVARITLLEAIRAEIPEDRIVAAAALVLRERAIHMEELGLTFHMARRGGADCDRIARHNADIEHMVADAVRRGIKLGRGEA